MAGYRLAWRLRACLLVSVKPCDEEAEGPSGPDQNRAFLVLHLKPSKILYSSPPRPLGVGVGPTTTQSQSSELPFDAVAISKLDLEVDASDLAEKDKEKGPNESSSENKHWI